MGRDTDEGLAEKATREIDRLLTDFEPASPEDSASELPTEDLKPTEHY